MIRHLFRRNRLILAHACSAGGTNRGYNIKKNWVPEERHNNFNHPLALNKAKGIFLLKIHSIHHPSCLTFGALLDFVCIVWLYLALKSCWADGNGSDWNYYAVPPELNFFLLFYPRFVPPALHAWAIINLFLRNKCRMRHFGTKSYVFMHLCRTVPNSLKFYVYFALQLNVLIFTLKNLLQK